MEAKMFPKRIPKRGRQIDAKIMPKWPQNGTQKPPKKHKKTLNNLQKSDLVLKMSLLDLQGLILEDQSPILDVNIIIFRPQEGRVSYFLIHFCYYFSEILAETKP